MCDTVCVCVCVRACVCACVRACVRKYVLPVVKLAMDVLCCLLTPQDFCGLYDRDKLFWKTIQVWTNGTLYAYSASTPHAYVYVPVYYSIPVYYGTVV